MKPPQAHETNLIANKKINKAITPKQLLHAFIHGCFT